MAILKLFTGFLYLSFLGHGNAAPRANQCCSLLHSQHPDHVFFANTSAYQSEAVDSYWSKTAQLHPSCVFTPTSAETVSQAIKLFTKHNCSFAIRSGGHSSAEGWANIDNGVLLATTNLSSISLGDGYASVGPGLRWGSVYNYLEPHGLVVLGGRGGAVGVGGLTLGGGVSHFTPEHGLGCDNVKGFQIVTATGAILEANAESHPELWQALKGSQNMLGVVTRFDLYTYPSPQLHSLSSQINMTDFDQAAEVYDDYLRNHSNEKAAEKMAVGLTSYYVAFLGDPFLSLSLHSWSGQANSSWIKNNTAKLELPAPLRGFQDLPQHSVTEESGSMAKLATGGSLPSLRYDLRTLSFKSSPEMLKGMKRIFEEEFEPVFQKVKSFSGIIEWQIITKNAIEQGYAKGGNVLGLDVNDPIIIFAMANSWESAAGDEAAFAAGHQVVRRGEALAKQLGTHVPFVYANYAAKGQDVLSSYGEGNIAKLRKVKNEYDPRNQLSKLLPGGLSGMPLSAACSS